MHNQHDLDATPSSCHNRIATSKNRLRSELGALCQVPGMLQVSRRSARCTARFACLVINAHAHLGSRLMYYVCNMPDRTPPLRGSNIEKVASHCACRAYSSLIRFPDTTRARFGKSGLRNLTPSSRTCIVARGVRQRHDDTLFTAAATGSISHGIGLPTTSNAAMTDARTQTDPSASIQVSD